MQQATRGNGGATLDGAAARSHTGSRHHLVWGGAVHLVLWVYGLVIVKESSADVVPVNNADNWLHVVLGLGMIALGVVLPGRRVDHSGRVTGGAADSVTTSRSAR